MAKNWDKIRKQAATDTLRNRDVYETQQLDRTKVGQKQSFTSRHIIAICVGVLCGFMLWAMWSIYDMKALDNQSAADAKVATVITEPAPDEPRDLADVTWANMIMVEDNTYAKYGYTYMDKRTGVKYTQAEYDIWLDVQRRINSGECPEILRRANADGTYTYKERDAMAPAPEKPRDFSHADYINFIQRGVSENDIYKDLGYRYYANYKSTYLTKAEYDIMQQYTNDYINLLIDEGLVTYKVQDSTNSDGAPITVYVFYDIDDNVIEPIIPEESAGERYYTPIELDDVVWANMQLVKNSSASSLGYSYMDQRTGLFYTTVEYSHWSDIYYSALYGYNGYMFWMDVSEEDGGYTFALTPPSYASDEPRERFLNYLTPTLMMMNLTENSFWEDYGYLYYDTYTLTFYSQCEYDLWLDVQNKVASGELKIPAATQSKIRNESIEVSQIIRDHLDPLPVKHTYGDGFRRITFMKAFASLGVGFMVYALLKALLKKNLDAQNLMNDTSDINQYENDQHIALPEEVQRKFDWFPDVGAHCPVQVSSMISHMMITNKGLNKVKFAKRAEKDIIDEDGDVVYYKGEMLYSDNGEPMTEMLPLIDSKFADDLYEASGAPKEVRKFYDTTKIPYNPDGKDRTKQLGTHKTVADAINKTWTFPLYEPQRPAGAYIVDTEPVNTMVLAITRAGKGQTVIEPTIDMWTREMNPNNMVINDPKGELLVKNYVRGTVRGFQIVQFNLINAMKTDIYNPLGMAADAAREGDFTKCAMYVDNIAGVFFPVDGADDPVWPNAANNAFKRAAYGLMDYYLEEEKELRLQAERVNLDPKVLETKIDQMWGKVTLYNCYQLFVQLTSKKLKNPAAEFQALAKMAQEHMESQKDPEHPEPHPNPDVQALIDMSEEEYAEAMEDIKTKAMLWEEKPEADLLTLYFSATDMLPRNSMRNLVANANNALKSMAGAEKMLASVYGIAITAMSFFTDPTIATLTSGTPSQNVDLAGMSFPRRLGVRFHNDYIKLYHLMGLQVKWCAFEDELFEKPLGKDFEHEDLVTREGWARYYFKGLFPNDVTYLRMQIKNPDTSMLVKEFYFKFEKTYQTSLDGRFYVKDPVLGTKIVKNGILTELKGVRRKSTGEKLYIPRKTTFKRDAVDFMQQSAEKKRVNAKAIIRTMCRYSEKPKMVFLVTPPHLMNYAKLILILIKQLVDLNFDQSYMTKDNQKPLYKTRFMLDELGNLQSEGHGISGFETMLSIGLGQEQQFTLILQTLQQLKDVYGDSVDKIVQGNTSNIVFLKSTDDAMIDTLQKMSGTTHKSFTDSKTITRDMQKLMMQNEGKASYTMTTKEVPVISYNDMAFISERNSIIFRAGDSPVWNRNETILPMSWRLFKTTITQPGKNYTLQTIPTLSSALDFDIRQNQPDFIKMLDKRIAQACKAGAAMDKYKTAYNYSDAELAKLDIDAYSDEIMDLINAMLNDNVGKKQASDATYDDDMFDTDDVVAIDDWSDEMLAGSYTDDVDTVESYGSFDASNLENNDDVQKEAAKRQAVRDEFDKKIYAGGYLAKSDLIRPDGSVKTHGFDKDFSEIFANNMGSMLGDKAYFNDVDGNLYGIDGKPYIIKNDNSAMIAKMNEAAQDEETNVYSEEDINERDLTDFNTYMITDAFYLFLANLNSWSFADGRFEDEMKRRMAG